MSDQLSRVAMVTGAASGIGYGIAAELAEHGYRVALLDRDARGVEHATQRIAANGADALAVVADVSSAPEVTAAIELVLKRWARIDILVNNAGFARDAHLLDLSLDDWRAVVDTHLTGAFLTIRAAAPGMTARGWGRIVNISSISALGDDERANYVAAKSGLEGLTRAAAIDLAPAGVTVNAVGPGPVPTAMTATSAARAGRTVQQHIAAQAISVARGRIGTPHDIARGVLFFVAEDADFVTGQILYISGSAHG